MRKWMLLFAIVLVLLLGMKYYTLFTTMPATEDLRSMIVLVNNLLLM